MSKERVILLPVKVKGSIKGYKDGSLLFKYKPDGIYLDEERFVGYYELYIISYEAPLQGDWYYDEGLNDTVRRSGDNDDLYSDCKKIIATTDRLRVPDDSVPYPKTKGLPKIPQWFIQLYIERYNRKNKIREVVVDPDILVNNTIYLEPVNELWSREELKGVVDNVLNEIQSNFSLTLGDLMPDIKKVANNWIDKNI